MPKKRTLSPREFAQAIGASESSIKRWVDEGRIQCIRTEGGHRRIPIVEAVRFVREGGYQVVDARALGIERIDDGPAVVSSPTDQLYEHLRRGDLRQAKALLSWLFLTGQSLASLCDGPLRESLQRLDRETEGDARAVFFAHRATEICKHALQNIRLLLPETYDGPTAIGGAVLGDPSTLEPLMVATVLQSEGWNPVPLGPSTPATAMLHGIDAHRAKLAWLNVNAVHLEAMNVASELKQLIDGTRERGTKLALGGRRMDLIADASRQGVFVGRSMGELVAFSRGLLSAASGTA